MTSRQVIFTILACTVALLFCWQLFSPTSYHHLRSSSTPKPIYAQSRTEPRHWTKSGTGNLEGIESWRRPRGLNKIVGLIFYGRPATVSILDCYLKRNLAKNGGMLDEVVWVVRTDSAEDKGWLDVMMKTEPAYTKWIVPFNESGDYRSSYDQIKNGTMYIKMDDDIVRALFFFIARVSCLLLSCNN
jgi:hypothetical protein